MSNVPAARNALAVLRLLAAAPGPQPAVAIARELQLPRSSAYHLLAAMAEDGFVLHYPEERRWGLGVSALEVGTAYLRHDPLERLVRPLLGQLVRRLPRELPAVATCGVLHGGDVLYVATETAARRLTVVAEVGVRLPAPLTASGRAMLAHLPAAQLRAIFPGPLVQREDRGPASLTDLRRLLAREREAGVSLEEGSVTPGLSSIASAVLDQAGLPVASIGVTVRAEPLGARERATLAAAVTRTATELARRLGSRRGSA